MRVSWTLTICLPLLLLSTFTNANSDLVERSALEIEYETATELIEEESEDNDNEDVEVTAFEPSDKIKAENIDKCDKCLKSTFRYRHDGFCGKCVSNSIIDVNEQQEINDAMRCKKCTKPKFRSRHLLFCSDNCYEEVKSTTTTTTTTTTTPSTTSEQPKVKVSSFSAMKNTVPNMKTKNQIKVKEDKNKSKNKEMKQKRRDQRRKEKKQRKLMKQKNKSGQTFENADSSEAAKLGPLGNVLKYLIVANTWKEN